MRGTANMLILITLGLTVVESFSQLKTLILSRRMVHQGSCRMVHRAGIPLCMGKPSDTNSAANIGLGGFSWLRRQHALGKPKDALSQVLPIKIRNGTGNSLGSLIAYNEPPSAPMTQKANDGRVPDDESDSVARGKWGEFAASVALSVGFLWAFTHTLYFISLFLLGMRSSLNPWSLAVWQKAMIFAKSDLAAGFVGSTLNSLWYSPLIQVTIDVRWAVALVGAFPLSKLVLRYIRSERMVRAVETAKALFAQARWEWKMLGSVSRDKYRSFKAGQGWSSLTFSVRQRITAWANLIKMPR